MERPTKGWVDYLSQNYNSISSELRRTYVLLKVIEDCLPTKNCRILEVGCGSAITSFALGEYGYSIFCIDNDSDVLEWTIKCRPFFLEYISFSKADMCSLPFDNNTFDLGFSQGLLEHYPDEKIIESLHEQSRVAKIVVFDVPNDRHSRDRLKGDERLLSASKYIELCKEAHLKVVSVYGRRWIQCLTFLDEEVLFSQPWLTKFCAQNSIFVCHKN